MQESPCNSVFMVDAYNTWMSSVGASKGIIDKDISKTSELLSKSFDIFRIAFYFISIFILNSTLLLRMESDIFAQKYFSLWVPNLVMNRGTNAVI